MRSEQTARTGGSKKVRFMEEETGSISENENRRLLRQILEETGGSEGRVLVV